MKDCVTVLWYGQVLSGELVERKKDGSILDMMLAVKIPVQGTQIVALFTPEHVYKNAEELIKKTLKEYVYPKHPQIQPLYLPQESVWKFVETNQQEINTQIANLSTAQQRLQRFKQEHWDQEHNHLKIDALNEFYQIWRRAVAAKNGVNVEAATVQKAAETEQNPAVVEQKAASTEQEPAKIEQKTVKFTELFLFD